MDVIKRNIFALLRTGAFGDLHNVEPMSAYKWRKLFAVLGVHDVLRFAYQGYTKQQYPNVRHIPQPILHELKLLEEKADNATTFSANHYAQSELSNKLLSNRLNGIRENEPHAMDTSPETLHALNIIVYNVETLLNKGVMLRGVVDLGVYLRTKGHRIDFVKLENWLSKLHIETLAQFQGSILVQLLGFEQPEVPFAKRVMPDAKKVTLRAVEQTVKDTSENWDFKQGKTLWISVNSKAIRQSMRRSLHYVLYAPIETMSNLTYKFAKNLSELEE